MVRRRLVNGRLAREPTAVTPAGLRVITIPIMGAGSGVTTVVAGLMAGVATAVGVATATAAAVATAATDVCISRRSRRRDRPTGLNVRRCRWSGERSRPHLPLLSAPRASAALRVRSARWTQRGR